MTKFSAKDFVQDAAIKSLEEKLIDITRAQSERIDQLELDLSRQEKLVKALMHEQFLHIQGGTYRSYAPDSLIETFRDEWQQWLDDNRYVEGHGLLKIEEIDKEIRERLKMLVESGHPDPELDMGIQSLRRMKEKVDGR